MTDWKNVHIMGEKKKDLVLIVIRMKEFGKTDFNSLKGPGMVFSLKNSEI